MTPGSPHAVYLLIGETAHTPYCRALGPASDLSVVKFDPIATAGIVGNSDPSPPQPRTPIGPLAWSYCRVLGGGGFL